jgi:hypothetical protein
MIFYRKFRRYLVWFAAVNLVLVGTFQESHAGETAGANSPKQCVQRDGITFNGVGLWTRMPAVLKLYGQPLRVEPMESINSDRVNADYTYKDIKLFIFNSIVWQVDVLTPDISSKSGIRLLSDFSAVEKILGVKLKNSTSGQISKNKYKVPICPPDPPEVEEYVILGFDQNNRLIEFTAMGVMP